VHKRRSARLQVKLL